MSKVVPVILTVLLLLMTFQFGTAQTDPKTRLTFQKNGIKTVKRYSYTLWNRNAQKPYAKPVLSDINEEHYDSLGNLVLELNKTNEESLKDVLNFKKVYKYDEWGNLVSEHLENNFLPIDTKWTYSYYPNGQVATKTSFDLHGKPYQIRYYFYRDEILVKDSLTQQGEPLFVTKYEYENGLLKKQESQWAKPVKYQLAERTVHSYTADGKLKKSESVFNRASDILIRDFFNKRFYYDQHGNLIKKKEGLRIIKFHYDKNGTLIKKCDYKELPKKRYSYKVPFCEEIEYEYY